LVRIEAETIEGATLLWNQAPRCYWGRRGTSADISQVGEAGNITLTCPERDLLLRS
jgi:hypothetical protein